MFFIIVVKLSGTYLKPYLKMIEIHQGTTDVYVLGHRWCTSSFFEKLLMDKA
jgi:hypothetical protein